MHNSYLVFSNRLEALLLVLKKMLFIKGALPFQKRFIVVPCDAMKEMIFSFFALDPELQVAAGIKVVSLNAFFAEMGEKILPSSLALSLRIQETLLHHLTHPLFEPVREYLGDNRAKRLGVFCDALAMLFSRYGVYGGEKLDRWLQEKGWQQFLWKELNFAYPIKALSHLECKQEIHVFGFSDLPPLYLSFFKRSGAFLYEISCCQMFWGEIVSQRELHFLKDTLRKEIFLEEGNPWLATWGKIGREKLLFFEKEGVQRLEAYVPLGSSFLARVQKALLEMQPFDLSSPDDSIQIWAAHHPKQEVENLYALITSLMEKEQIKREEVLILAPSLEEYLPWIEQVFQIPFRVYDLAKTHERSFLKGILAALKICEHNFSLQSLLDLMEFPLKAEFSFSEEEKLTLLSWFKKAHIREGKEEWNAGLERLLLGLCVLPEEEREYSVFPEQILEWSGSDLLEKFLLFFQTLLKSLSFFSEEKEYLLSEWISYFYHLGTFLFEGEDTSLLELSFPGEERVPFKAVERILLQEGKRKMLSPKLHAITCASLQGNYIQKAKITCVLGMGEEAYPRRDRKDSLQTLEVSMPSTCQKDQYRFLELLTNTSHYFLMSYVKIDPEDQKEKGPSSLLKKIQEDLKLPLLEIPLERTTAARAAHSAFIAQAPLENLPPAIRIEHLRLLARNPLQFYLNQSLGVYLEEEEQEELLLSPWDKAILRQKGVRSLNQYAARSKLPRGAFGLLAQEEVIQSCQEYEENLKNLNLLGKSFLTLELSPFCKAPFVFKEKHFLVPALKIEDTSIIGRISHFLPEGFALHAKDHPEDLLKHYPLLLVQHHLGFEKTLFLTKDGVSKTVSLEETFPYLKRYLELYQKALSCPLPFLPAWIPLLLKGEEKKWKKALEQEDDPHLQWLLRRDASLFVRTPFSRWQEEVYYFFEKVPLGI